jgi:class 3 adenylate cyclase
VRRDIEAFESLVSPDVIGFTTGGHERFVGREQYKAVIQQLLAETESSDREFKVMGALKRGSLVIGAVEYDLQAIVEGRSRHWLLRWTGVLERHHGRLRAVQVHVSMPASDQPEGQAFPTPIEAIASAVTEERPELARHAAPDGTVTMLFTDIENSTVLTERLGDTQWLELLRAHNSIVREHVKAKGCFEVKSQGDGFMIASQSARRALQCAIGIQRDLAGHNEGADEPINVRMGLHTGEVLKDADDFFGKHVILASRIAGKARGGEILVSSLLRELTESGGDVRFGEPREVELKGLTGSHVVHEVVWERADEGGS